MFIVTLMPTDTTLQAQCINQYSGEIPRYEGRKNSSIENWLSSTNFKGKEVSRQNNCLLHMLFFQIIYKRSAADSKTIQASWKLKQYEKIYLYI